MTPIAEPATPQAADTGAAASGGPMFWFAVPEQRSCHDPATGSVGFVLEPGTWYLAEREVAGTLTVRSNDGRTGVLHDLRGIHRA
jgi:hypothetical protein